MTELELCHGRGDCADGVIESVRLAFEFEADDRDALREEQNPPRDRRIPH
jgi:hypothetical protein